MSPDVKNLKTLPHIYRTFFSYGLALAAQAASTGQVPTVNEGPIVRPNLQSAPGILGNWTDGRISCRHSAPSMLWSEDILQKVLPKQFPKDHFRVPSETWDNC